MILSGSQVSLQLLPICLLPLIATFIERTMLAINISSLSILSSTYSHEALSIPFNHICRCQIQWSHFHFHLTQLLSSDLTWLTTSFDLKHSLAIFWDTSLSSFSYYLIGHLNLFKFLRIWNMLLVTQSLLWFGINTAYLAKQWILRRCLWDTQVLNVWLYDSEIRIEQKS